MFRSGSFVAEHVSISRPSQVQPNGVDLTVGTVFEQETPGAISRGGKSIGTRRELEPEGSETEVISLDRGAYILRYGERVEIPEDHVGFIYPRSSLLRNSCMLDTAVWDAGYAGKGEGLLEVHRPIEIERGARIAQLVLAKANHDGTYDGSYQSEHLD